MCTFYSYWSCSALHNTWSHCEGLISHIYLVVAVQSYLSFLLITSVSLLAIPGDERRKVMVTRPERRGRSWILLLLLVPFIVLLYPPFYNFDQPEFIGIPFFYWFQLLWVIITAIITAVLYALGV